MRANEIETCAAKIRAAERVLGRLTEGQRVDLLLDNFSWIPSSAEAREVVRAIEAEAQRREREYVDNVVDVTGAGYLR